ncbi:MAG: alkaline phosphatase [Bacteroidales bacterium]|nr:alkaline phosphatase [Bacteroidales bacterium]
MKRLLILFTLAFTVVGCQQKAPQAKYVFYFIGDGMGLAQVSLTEAWLADREGHIGSVPLSFSEFPVYGTATTHSASNIITCSSAAGTALAVGEKTTNNMLGMSPDTLPLQSITYKIKEAGFAVGITSTVTLDHATPAAFYASAPSRSDYYDIALQLPETGFDFFGGGGFIQPEGKEEDKPSVLPIIEEAGYTIAYGMEEFEALHGAEKMVLIQEKDRDYLGAIPFAIDRTEEDMTHAEIVRAAISFLDNEKGFFLMSEGGRIDWACHANDGLTTILETIDMDLAVQVAIEFAKKHPNETLIVVTADHETGGLSLGWEKRYTMHFDQLEEQYASKDKLLDDDKKDVVEQIEEMNRRARIGWTTSSHTGIPVPVYAMGAGSELFAGRMDNTDIPKKICEAMGLLF